MSVAAIFTPPELPECGAFPCIDLSRAPRLQQETINLQHVKTLVSDLMENQDLAPKNYGNTLGQEVERLRLQSARLIDTIQDPALWFKDTFSLKPEDKVTCKTHPLGIVLSVEGYAYGRFVDNYAIRRPGTISLGTTLFIEHIPSELRGRVIVVNEGDGYTGTRSKQAQEQTEKHEKLHLIFNAFFNDAEFICTPKLEYALSLRAGIRDTAAYEQLASDLGNSMFERARSEIISYCGSGDFNLHAYELDVPFWRPHFETVCTFLNQQQFSDDERKAVLEVFQKSFSKYWEHITALYKIALSLPRENGCLSYESLATLFLTTRDRMYQTEHEQMLAA